MLYGIEKNYIYIYIVWTQFESLAQGMDELGPKKPNAMNL